MELVSRAGTYYENPEMAELKVGNRHFDVVDTYNMVVGAEGEWERVVGAIYTDMFTAVAEDVLTKGEVALQVFADGKSRDGMKLTHPKYAWGEDIVKITVNGARKRRDDGDDYGRQVAEVVSSRSLRKEVMKAEQGEMFALCFPPDLTKASGYKAMSMTYVYRVVGPPVIGKRRIEGVYYKSALSLEGNRRLWNWMSQSDRADEFKEEDLIARLVPLGEHGEIESFDDVTAKIDELSGGGGELVLDKLVDGGSGGLSLEAFDDYKGQMYESVRFFLMVLDRVYKKKGRGLDQAGVNEMEVAYSISRRAVESYSPESGEVLAEQMWEDFKAMVGEDERLEAAFRTGDRGVVEEEVVRVNLRMENRYGDLQPVMVGGAACPPGMLAGLGIGGYDRSFEGPTLSSFGGYGLVGGEIKSWGYHDGKCVAEDCPSHGKIVKVGPCSICKVCESKFDAQGMVA